MSFEPLGPGSPPEELASRAGGKAARLADLERLGCNVPPWFCVPAEAFDAALAAPGGATARGDGAAPGPAGALASDDAADPVVAVPERVAEPVLRALDERALAGEFVAVRSSGLAEDGAEASFAGQFSSYLYRRGGHAVLDALGRCWGSAFAARNVAYRRAMGVDDVAPRMGVIVQRMVDSESAGVAFSRDPLDPTDRDALVVEAVWGQGEGLVAGELDADRFRVDRESLAFEATLAAKSRAVVRDPERGGTRTVDVDAERAARPALTPEQVREVAGLALRLEAELGAPQDVEWAYADGRLFVLQTRPITTLPPDALFAPDVAGDGVVVWDNSNIIESYAGVTTPLTFSHVSRAYREVYYQTCRVAGVPERVVEAHEPIFRNMLGLVRGRIYYNLLNWYRLLALFPLLGRSGAFMETMMGVKQSLEADLRPLVDAVLDEAPRYGIARRVGLAVRLGTRMLGGERANARFLERVDRVCRPLEATDLRALSLPRQMELYRRLDDEVLRHWTAPIINDTRCMIAFGLLQSLTRRWLASGGADEAASLQNDLLCGEGDLKSTEPMRLLLEIAREVDASPPLKERFLEEPPEELWRTLREAAGEGSSPAEQDALARLGPRFHAYIRDYGYRCVDELKLESPDFHDRPHLVVASVQNYLRHGVPSVREMDARKAEIRGAAERRVREELRGPRRALYRGVLRWARRAVRDRERLRFERTRTFGVVRRLFRAAGENLTRLGLLDAEDDVFYLTVEEILGVAEGRAVSLRLDELAALRRREYDAYRESPPPPDRFVTKGAAGASFRHPALLQAHDLLAAAAPDDPDVLVGTPCCPGVVEAPVRVAARFEDTEGIDGEILVTERTDPGWVPVFPACAGLIIERGSLLSHSAVVARELGIPTIVGVGGDPLARLATGQRVRMDAGRGEVRIL